MIENIPTLIKDMSRTLPSIQWKKKGEYKPQHVNLYRACNGRYYTTNSGQKVSRAVVEKALRENIIVPEWENKPDLEYWKL